jgi:hypothetical protein
MSSQDTQTLRSAPRVAFGAILFVAWGIETVLWLASTVHLAADGEITPVITAVAAIALMLLLTGMEGLEVAVIDRSRVLFAGESTLHRLAAWLAARQLFVALIVTSATLLANRSEIIVPWTSISISHGILLGLFDLTWTGFTVLWFAQILPKHLAAMNPDRYLMHLRGPLFPIVDVVRKIGVSQPGEWVAAALERRLHWEPTPVGIEEAPLQAEHSLGSIWRALIPPEAPADDRRQAPRMTGSERTVE